MTQLNIHLADVENYWCNIYLLQHYCKVNMIQVYLQCFHNNNFAEHNQCCLGIIEGSHCSSIHIFVFQCMKG